jgi:hypothetical protein
MKTNCRMAQASQQGYFGTAMLMILIVLVYEQGFNKCDAYTGRATNP